MEIESIISKYSVIHKENPAAKNINEFKSKIGRAVTNNIVHKGLGLVDHNIITAESRRTNIDAGVEFMHRITNINSTTRTN